jgi:ethanolamine ammonia-lyase small subunit
VVTVRFEACEPETDLQVVIAHDVVDAAPTLVADLLSELWKGSAARGRSVGRPIVLNHWQPAAIAHIGEILRPAVILALVADASEGSAGPGVSAYLTHAPRASTTGPTSRIRTDGDPKLVALRVLTAASTLVAASRDGAS